VASRYSDYDTFGDTTNSKVGLRWKPIEQLLFRGTWAEGFRAPTIANLYGGGSQTFSFFTDPCDVVFGGSQDPNSPTRANCRADLGALADTFRQLGQGFLPVTTSNSQTPVAFTSGSNPFLQPETSTSKTAGIVWSPDFVEGLNLALDWWRIRVENTIVADSPGQILSDCYNDGIAERCLLFTRDPVLGYVNNLRFGSRNAGFRETEGYDFDVSYRFETENWGTFRTQWNTTYTARDEFLSTNDPGIPTQQVSFAGAGSFRIRSNLNLSWERGDFGATWNVRYFSALKEDCLSAATYPDECNDADYRSPNTSGVSIADPQNVSGATVFNDVQFRWNAPWKATISIGANNVFEKYGPVFYSQPSANVSYYGGFDIGRFWYARYTQRF
jgi:iron complex outermembrane receptor protein